MISLSMAGVRPDEYTFNAHTYLSTLSFCPHSFLFIKESKKKKEKKSWEFRLRLDLQEMFISTKPLILYSGSHLWILSSRWQEVPSRWDNFPCCQQNLNSLLLKFAFFNRPTKQGSSLILRHFEILEEHLCNLWLLGYMKTRIYFTAVIQWE